MIPPNRTIRSSDLKLFTDASDLGYGGTFGNAWFQSGWTLEQLQHSIDYRELYAIVAAAFTWGHQWKGKRIVFVTDNEPITKVWDKGSSPSPPVMSLIRPLYMFAALQGFTVSFKYIKGSLNIAADALSRFQTDDFRDALPQADPHPTRISEAVLHIQSTPPSKPSKNKQRTSSTTP